MDFNSVAESIWRQILTVWEAPVPFIAVSIAIWFLVKLYFSKSYHTRLENAQSIQELQDRQIQDYKEKLDGATPEEAAARIAEAEENISRLKKVVTRLEPKQRTIESKYGQKLIDDLKKWPKEGPWQVGAKNGDSEAYRFAGEVREYMIKNGYSTLGGITAIQQIGLLVGHNIRRVKELDGVFCVSIGECPKE